MPLKKSYSESIGAGKRSSWQRSHSHPAGLQTPKPRPPIPVSDATKNKLSKFKYEEAEEHGCEPAAPEATSSTRIKADQVATPAAARLNWRDLVDPSPATEDEVTVLPNDKILWDNKRQPVFASGLSPLVSRKGTKRARSSSPMSSPATEAPAPPSLNVQKLAKALKSPHADPTLELWDRYSLARNESPASAVGFTNPSLAQLMVSSSPRPSKDVSSSRSSSSLRRTVSCGLQAPKRRKFEKPKPGSQGSRGQRDLEAASKSSLVTALLETVTSSMQDLSQDPSTPTAESPSPKKPSAMAPPQLPNNVTQPPEVMDYFDDDFDDDIFMEMEKSMNPNSQTPSKAAPISATVATSAKGFQSTDLDDLADIADDDFDDDVILAQAKNAAVSEKTSKGATDMPKNEPDEFDDEFDDDIAADFDIEAMEFAATQTTKKNSSNIATSKAKTKTIQRYLVTQVLEGEFTDSFGNSRPEKVLMIEADNTKMTKTLRLRGSWFETPAQPQAYVHVIGQFTSKGQCIIDDNDNLLILHPDQLISATVVADSFGCTRRAVLQDRVKATSDPSAPLVYGTMLHEIFQEALLANTFDRLSLSKIIDRITEKHVEDLYTIKVGIPIAKEYLQSKMLELSHWAKAFVSSKPKPDAIVEGRHGEKANMAVTKLLDVEEHVWSPMYGLKGNIDATVEVAMFDGKQTRTLTVPFEVKTGKNANTSHVAQTALYTLLLSDRYDIDITYGVLYYMETSKTMRVPAIRHELRQMILQRNQLACYVRERSVQLPPMLQSKHMCGRCYAKTSCFIYHKLADNGDGETSGMGEKFDEVVKHLTPLHQEFFVKWENLLTLEEKESQKTKRELWTMTSVQREKKSRCFADVIIEEGSSSVDNDTPRINRFNYSFVKRLPQAGFSFLESELSVGEPVVVSDEEGHYALAIGYVTAVQRKRISVAVDRRLHNTRIRQPGFDEVDNQVFASIMEVAPEGATPEQSQGRIKEAPIGYRLDQDEFSNGMATVRNNLVQMMANDVPAARKIRELIVDLKKPRFKTVATQYSISGKESLNVDQQAAIDKVMSAQDYALVLGMPGTGKTTTIAHIIRALTSQGKSVLLTSHTHTAVDNILLKLKSDKMKVLRLGAPAKVHPGVQDFAILAGHPMSTFEEIKDAWHGTPVVATTCLGINHTVFQERSFDYCIVDEASQISLPICAGPIRMARTFVLVGDHNQLPPVVKNEQARTGGLDVSLFKLLSDAHPESVVNLAHQYRMCEDIMTLSNTLIYNGQLRCGTEELKTRKLSTPNMAALSHRHYNGLTLSKQATPRSICPVASPSQCWLYDLVDSDARVRFVNTDTLVPAIREEAHGKRIVNSAEISIVSQLVDSFLTVGVPAEEVGVMTHYRAQLSLFKDKLKSYPGIEMHTTDRFQGRDKEVILLSLVRSNEACNIGDLLKDWRRINVAFTRAKTKLLVVGSVSTLKGSGEGNMLSKFISLMEEKNWIYDLPTCALDNHNFEDLLATQFTATAPTPITRTPKQPKHSTLKSSPSKGKENMRPTPRSARAGEKVLLKGKPITRDILNEMTNGAY